MVIKVNGKEVNLEKEVTIKELLVIQQVQMPDYVTVQVNEELVDQGRFNEVVVKDQDTVEFLYFMGGGSC
ncbi:sulfur carrier protein ThiS [Desulfitobacterium sp.]|uniref:sulfur carrier protein ThiS n=1 Tax=Desulfitobacterium sp. TaxID=49981 RepID=UPI002CAEA124|nr:sulfur carrier protein ThiS [Desulfitobacterium sp.]HVJ49046.1 sulfur carrier protein ThiS [Desulfitobacterium sp.]